MQKKIARIVAVALMLTVGMTFTLAIPEGADAATAKPSKVATLKVKSTGYNSIKVYWTKTKNAKKYQVYRATSKWGKYKKIATTSARSYTNKSLTTGKYYYYKVRGVNGSKVGSFSSVKYTKPYLGQVTNLSAYSKSNTSIGLKWDKVSGAKSYQIYRATSKSGKYSKIKTTTKNYYTNTGRTFNKTYYYKVRAVRSSNVGKFSSVKAGKATFAKVTGVKASSPSYDKIEVSWDRVSGASAYEIYRATSKTGTYSKVYTTKSSKSNKITQSSLSFNKTYYYKVRAIKGSIKGPFSSVAYAKTCLESIKYDDIGAEPYDNYTSVKVSWDDVDGADGYVIYRADQYPGKSFENNAKYFKEYARIKGNVQDTYIDKNVKSGENYYYRVMAYKVVGSKIYYSDYGKDYDYSGVTLATNDEINEKLLKAINEKRMENGLQEVAVNDLLARDAQKKAVACVENDGIFKDDEADVKKDLDRLLSEYQWFGGHRTYQVGTLEEIVYEINNTPDNELAKMCLDEKINYIGVGYDTDGRGVACIYYVENIE